MDEKVADTHDRIALVFADIDVSRGAVLFADNAVQSKRNGDVLIFFNAAVVVRVQKSKAVGLVQRILFKVETGRVDVSAQNSESFGERLFADNVQNDVFVFVYFVQLVAGLNRLYCFDVFKSLGFGCFNRLANGKTFGLGRSEEVFVIFGKIKDILFLFFGNAVPYIFCVHRKYLRFL